MPNGWRVVQNVDAKGEKLAGGDTRDLVLRREDSAASTVVAREPVT